MTGVTQEGKFLKNYLLLKHEPNLIIYFCYRIGKPQPDNREFIQQNGAPETCLAILNNFYGDGVHWHDVACHHKKPIVCEDSDALLKYVRFTSPDIPV